MEQELRQHIIDDREFQQEIKGDIKVIKENHLFHIEKHTEKIATDLEWVKKFFWIIATAIIGLLVNSLWGKL